MSDPQSPSRRPVPPTAAATGLTPYVVGLDLSLTASGVASSRGWTETVFSTGKADATLAQRRERLVAISTVVHGLAHHSDLVVIEAPAFSRTTGHMHDRSGLWWAVVHGLMSRDIPVVEVTATTLKKYATGKGNATKPDMRVELYRRAGVDLRDDNQVDAVWLAHLGCHLLGRPLLNLPQTHLVALDKVARPVVA